MLTFVGGMVFCFVNLLFKGLGNELQIVSNSLNRDKENTVATNVRI